MDNSAPIQVVDDLALVPLTQTEVASLNLQSIGVITITGGGGGGGGGNGDMLKSVFATLNPAAGFVDKAITASNLPYTGLTSLPGGSINFLRADGTFAPPPGQIYSVVSIGTAGLAPSLIPSGGSGTYLRGDGSWAPYSMLSINYSQLIGTPLKFDPIVHGFQHVTGGNDPMSLATSTATGLVQILPSAPNQVTSFLRGDNTWQPLPVASFSAPGLVPTLTGVNTAFFNAAGGYSVPVFSSLSGLPAAFNPIPHALTHVTPGPQQDLLPQFSKAGGLPGVVPASLGDTVNYLRADGIWSAPPGGGGLATDTGAGLLRQLQAPANQSLYYLLGNNTWDLISNLSINFNKLIGVPIFSGGSPGLVPNSLGGTNNYLRADGVYSVPTGAPVTTGSFGTVSPLPSTGQLGYFLRGDNTWQFLSGITVDYTNQVTGKPAQFDPIPHHARHTTGGVDVIPGPTISSTGLVPILPSVTPSLFFLSGTGAFATIPIATPTSPGLVPTPPNQQNQWFRGDAQFATIPPADTINPGLAPVRSGNTTTFLRGDGTYHTVDYTSLTSGTVPPQFDPIAHSNRHVTGGADPIQNFSTTTAANGLVPGSSGVGAGKFLQADGSWTTPTGSGDVLHTLTITGVNSVSGGGDLSQNRTLQLANDVVTPGANSVYSYVSGTRGWNAFSSFPVVGVGVPGLVPAANATTAQFLNGTGSFSTPLTFTPTTSGIVPPSGGGQVNFLRADGWFPPPTPQLATTTNAGIVPIAPSNQSNTHYLAGNNTWVLNLNFPVAYSQISGVPVFTGSLPGLVPSSTGLGSQFLRGDGIFFTPPLAASAQDGYIRGLPSSAGTNYWARGDNSWQLLPDSVLVTSPWFMPTIGTPVSPVNVSDTSTLESGQTLIVVGTAGTNCLMEVGTIVSPGAPGSISLINRGYVMNPSSGTQIPGGLMFIAGPGVMTSTAPGFVPTPPIPPDGSKFLCGLGTWAIPPGAGGLSTVTTSGSVQGDGAGLPTAVQLVGDSSNPGAFKFYSTDGVGTKGWLPLTYSWETNAIFNMPGLGANQNILLVSNVGILIGMTLVIEDNNVPVNQAFVQVVSVNGDNVHIVVNNPGYAINSSPGTQFAINAAVTLAGPAMATASTPGFVPTPPNDTFKFLRGDAQFQVPNNVDTVHPGYVPIATNIPGQFLDSTGNWSIPTITTLASTGTQGAVRGLSATNQGTSFLRGDNQWALLNTITVDYTTQVTGKASTFAPSAHRPTHISTGSDPIDLFSTLTAVSGLVPGSSGASTTFLRGDGNWVAVPGSPGLATAGVDGLLKGLIASPTLQYLRGDNSWQPLAGITVDYTTQVTGKATTFAPTIHGSQHVTGGTDPIPVVAGSSTGLVPILPTVTPAVKYLDGTANFSVIPLVTNLASGLMPTRDGNAAHFYCSDGSQKVIPTMTATVGGLTPAVTPNSPLQWLRGDATYATLPEYWNISAGFTQPAPGSNTASVTFTTTVGMQVGMSIATTDTGSPPVTNYYTVATIIDGTHATLLNFGALGNTPAVSTVNAGIVALNGPPIVTPTGGGLVPRPPGDASQFLNGIGQFAIPTTSGVLLTSQTLGTQLSLTGGGTIAANLTLSLVNDTSPSAFQVYGTNGVPTRGWYNASSFPLFSTSTSTAGLAPGTSGVSSANFLCANGTWTPPSSIGPASGSSAGTVPQLPATPPAFPTQVQWLRADNTWQFPNNSSATTASWVMPAVGSTVAGVTFPSPNGTANFDAGMTLLFATGNGTSVCFMEIASVDTGTTMTLRNQGYNANASNPGNTVPAGPVYIAGPGVATSTFSGLVPTPPTVSPTVKFLRGDSTWTQVDYSMLSGSPSGIPQIQLSWQLNGPTFTQPPVGGTVNLQVVSSTSAVVNRGVIVPGAGYYFMQFVPDGTHITLQNNGHAYNQAPGTTGLGGTGVYIIGASNSNLFTSSWAGDVPKSTGTNIDFLRADGAWGSATGASFIQHASALTAASTTTPASQFTGNTTTGNCIIALVSPGAASNTISSVTDSNSNTYVHGVGLLTNANPVDLWYALNITGGTTPTVTAHLGSANTNSFVCIAEFSGVLTSAAADGAGSTAFQTAATNLSSGSLSTANANDLLIGFANWSTVFVSGEAAWNTFSDGFQYRVVNGTGSYASTFTISGAGNASSLIFALKGVSLASTGRQIIANSSTGSVIGGGDLSADRTLTLSGDATAPGNWFLYSTNGSGTKGWNASTSLPQATSTVAGLVPTPPSTNKTDQWLRGDATWVQAPPLAQTITATFTWPASGGTSASIAVDSSGNMRVGMALYFPGLGVAELMTIPDGTHITIRNNANSGNVTISTSGIAIGTSIYVGGGGSLCTTTSSGAVPNPSGSPTNSFLSGTTATFAVPSSVSTSGPGFVPTAPASASQFLNGLTGTWASVPYSVVTGTPVAATFNTSGLVPTPPNNTFTFLRGDATFAKPHGTMTTTTATFTVPAANVTVGVTINAVSWVLIGQKVYITDGTLVMFGNVTGVSSSTSITVRNTADQNNSVSGTMGIGATVVLVGFQNPIFRQWQAALEYSPPATLYAVFGTQNARAHLAFNDSATWTANFFGVVPAGTFLGTGVIVRLKWKSITVATGNARWNVAIERLNTAESADSFDTAVPITTACSGTTSALVESAITINTIDAVGPGDGIGVQVQRLGADAADTLVGDACLRFVTIESIM